MGVARPQAKPSKAGKRRVLHDGAHKPFAVPFFLLALDDEHVAEPRECSPIGNHTRIPDLGLPVVNAPYERVGGRAHHELEGYSLAPIGSREVRVDKIKIDTRKIGVDHHIGIFGVSV